MLQLCFVSVTLPRNAKYLQTFLADEKWSRANMDVIESIPLQTEHTNTTLENHCTRTAQSLRVGCSRRRNKIYYFGLLRSILWVSCLRLYILHDVFSLSLGYCSLFSTRENLSSVVCKQQKRRPACASAQSDQHLCYSLIEKYNT